uniref:Uncharacterized protein n=1 Tax=Anguilla anguilla TaxID=7936 RepID=A0A0E9PT31_ANGAN
MAFHSGSHPACGRTL